MSQRALDEREHRRGLVLGLTLAEVLILLLFLLLLALGARLQRTQGEARTAKNEITKLEDEIAKLKEEVQRYKRLLASVAVKSPANKDAVLIDAARDIFVAARRINPNDPPAAILAIDRVSESLTPEDIASISQMSPGDKIKVAIIKEGKGGGRDGEHDWPPIITLSDALGYFFEPGSAEPSTEFQAKLSGSVVAELLKIIEKYKVDVIEVIGHTDEQPVYSKPPMPRDFSISSLEPPRQAGRYPNLDRTLIPFLNGQEPLENVLPFDNAGLGLARAAAIARILRDDDRLRKYRILPLSAGQLILGSDMLSTGSPGNVRDRRRIEIRMRRADKSIR